MDQAFLFVDAQGPGVAANDFGGHADGINRLLLNDFYSVSNHVNVDSIKVVNGFVKVFVPIALLTNLFTEAKKTKFIDAFVDKNI